MQHKETNKKNRRKANYMLADILYGTVLWGILATAMHRYFPEIDTRFTLLLLPVYGIPFWIRY